MSLDNLLLPSFQFFMDIARDAAAERLEKGDVGNEGFRKFIKRDLHDIKTKLDNLSKIDLYSSLDYLEDGFDICIEKLKSDLKCEEASNSVESQATSSAIATRYDHDSRAKVFLLAKDRFKKSREEATRAFNNKNLSLEDKIFAVFVKIIAQIFECPEHQEIVFGLCVSYIKKLHQLKGVQEMFSLTIGGGCWAMFNQSRRMENIKSVILLNHYLYHLIAKINNNHDHLSTWPSIELEDGKMFNPIQDWRKKFAVESWYKNLIESQEMEKIKTMMIELLDKTTINEHFTPILTSPVELVMDVLRNGIFVAGGNRKSVEIFSWKEKKWFKIASMEDYHLSTSSFIYNDNLFIVGGYGCKSLQTLNIKQLPLTWRKFPTEFPYECRDHQTVVYKQQIILIGGDIAGKGRSDLISEIKITGTTSYVLKELCHMPELRCGHGAVVVDDKVVIFGGQQYDGKDLSSVLEFDPRTLTFKEMLPLPHPLTGMATVQWRDEVILLGGSDGKEILNSVIMYDSNTGEITVLPSMFEKRSWCCAVIAGDTIVVMGGKNVKYEDLESVEYFEMGSSSLWTCLPSMNKSRWRAIAEVLPFGQKYV
ncbi:kelch-like protein 12 [Xenia sp. Carnegie-2017]|uniref:kelch-like protein 12 n=1 Tax=Xenia sp. Carnegie-2017 TaxID=2897299 RepID=UPI001F049688|nr:kelch-like protein 12 [Xenia sp. Carnegie-2017]XP_046856529.1 kelch-like protein 12 [Xenia sp. Carnegie-2017]XP_046856530.1 kelch-like protein 12 [Xenia sp. Carnegie-2017]